MTLNELRQKRGVAIAALRAIQKKADDEKRALSAEEQEQWDRADKEQEELGVQVDAAQKDEARRSKLTGLEAEARAYTPAPVTTATTTTQPNEAAQVRMRALNKYLVEGRAAAFSDAEYRALQADLDTSGGYLRPPVEFTGGLIKTVDDLVFIRQLATKMTVTTADALGTATLEADPADAEWTAEIGSFSEDSTMSFGMREMTPHQLTKGIKISRKLMRQTSGGAAGLVQSRLGYKVAVTEEKAFLTGTGAGRPLGVFTASASGIPTSRDVSTDNADDAFTADGLMNALYSLKAPYQAKASWVFHRDGVKLARKLKDGNGQYLWSAGLGGEPDSILGRPFYMSEYAPNTFTTGLYVGVVGDFSYYHVVDAEAMELQRLEELYAATNQVGFIARMWFDGQPVLGEAFARVKLA